MQSYGYKVPAVEAEPGDEASVITGVVMPVDGGYLIS